MKPFLRMLGAVGAVGLSGCVVHLDNPPERKISGRVIAAETGAPVARADIWFQSGRKVFSLLPVDTFGIDAQTKTDEAGQFSVTARLNDKVSILIDHADFASGRFTLQNFPPANRIEGLVWKLSKKRP
jgi:hypothetical protein